MALQWTFYSLPPLVATLVALVLAGIAWRHRNRATGLPFFALMLAIAGWSATSGLRLATTTDTLQILFLVIGSVFATAIPVLWLWLTASYAHLESLLTVRVFGPLAAVSALFAGATVTNPLHGAMWESVTVASTSPRILATVPEVGFWASVTYAYVLILAGIGILVSVFLDASRVHRRQAGMLLVGTIVPLAVNVLFTFGVTPVPGVDFTPTSFTVTGVVFALALFRYDLLDYTPVAYRNVTDVLGDGVIVLDSDDHVREFNANAEQILDTSLTVGEPFDGSLGAAAAEDGGAVGTDAVIESVVDGKQRFFDVRRSPLPSRGRSTGSVIALRDVTPLREHEQRLEVTNRVLRHNLRNELNVVMGLARTVQDRIDDEDPALDTIYEKAASLNDLGDQARKIQQTMRRPTEDLQWVDLVGVARDVVRRYDDAWPAATVTLSAPEKATVLAPDENSLALPLSNLVENALEHNDRDDPTVTVEIVVEPDAVLVHVRDDGPGIPASELAVLAQGGETQLEHGSGLGLWLIHWTVKALGGEVSFAERDPRGTSVTIRLQRPP